MELRKKIGKKARKSKKTDLRKETGEKIRKKTKKQSFSWFKSISSINNDIKNRPA